MNRAEAAAAKLELHRAWRRLFLDDSGELTPDGRAVLCDIEAECGMTRTIVGTDNMGRIDPYRLAMNEGKRGVFVTVKRRLFEPLNNLVKAAEDTK